MVKAIFYLLFSLLTTGSFTSRYLPSNDYVGCYHDEKEKGRDLPFRPQTRRHNRGDALSCVLNCAESGFIYAGLQNGNLCFCGNKFGRYGRVPDTHCNLKCLHPIGIQIPVTTRKVYNSCGGKWANSVYAVRGIEYQEVKDTKEIENWFVRDFGENRLNAGHMTWKTSYRDADTSACDSIH